MVDKERYILCRQKIGRYFPYFLWPITIKSKECLAGIGGRQSIRHITTDLLWIRKSNPIIFCTYSSSRHSASPLSLSPQSVLLFYVLGDCPPIMVFSITYQGTTRPDQIHSIAAEADKPTHVILIHHHNNEPAIKAKPLFAPIRS